MLDLASLIYDASQLLAAWKPDQEIATELAEWCRIGRRLFTNAEGTTREQKYLPVEQAHVLRLLMTMHQLQEQLADIADRHEMVRDFKVQNLRHRNRNLHQPRFPALLEQVQGFQQQPGRAS